MKKNVLFLGLMLLASLNCFSQGDPINSNWIFGLNYGLHFSDQGVASNIIPPNSSNVNDYNASVSDECGNLLFFTDGHTVWRNWNNQYAAYTTTLNNAAKTNVAIIPKPGVPHCYYIVTLEKNSIYNTTSRGLSYSEIDLKRNNGFGEITNVGIQLEDESGTSIDGSFINNSNGLTSTLHSDGTNYWVIAYVYNPNSDSGKFLSFKVTSNGIGNNDISVNSTHGPSQITQYNVPFDDAISNLKASINILPNNTRRIALNSNASIYTGSFNPLSGEVLINSSPAVNFDVNNSITSIEFSSNSNVLYYTDNYSTNVIKKLLLTAPYTQTSVAINNTSQFPSFAAFNSLQIGSNGKIYSLFQMQNKIIEIADPDNFSTNTINYINMGTGFPLQGFPQLVSWQGSAQPQAPVFNLPSYSFCSGQGGESPLLPTSLNGYSGTWSPPFDSTTTTTYTFTPDLQCVNSVTATINVKNNLQNANWIFDQNTGLNFKMPTTSTFTTNTNSALPHQGAYQSVSDNCGNLLFVTDGYEIWLHSDGNFNLLYTGLQAHYGQTTQNVIVIPRPGVPYNYYIVTSGLYGLSYTGIDGLTGNLYDINTQLFDSNWWYAPAALASTTHSDGHNFWLVGYDVFGGFNSYIVTDSGIGGSNHMPASSLYGGPSPSSNSNFLIKIAPNGNEMVGAFTANPQGGGSLITLANFDNTSGSMYFYNSIDYPNGTIRGVEYSPDSHILYFSTLYNGLFKYSYYYGGNLAQVATPINTSSEYHLGDLQRALDGKVYCGTYNYNNPSNSLFLEINDPNNYADQNITTHALTGGVMAFYFPQWIPRQSGEESYCNMTPTFDQLGPYCGSECFSNVTASTGRVACTVLPAVSNEGITGSWTYPQGTVFYATTNPVSIVFTFTPAPGQCANTTTMTVVINPPVAPTFNQVAAICPGGSLAPLPTTSLNGVTGTWTPALDNTKTTTYTFHPNSGCFLQATMTIEVIKPTFNILAPICKDTSTSPLPTVSNDGYVGTWAPAFNNQATTTYTFTPTAAPQCTNKTTMLVTIIANSPIVAGNDNFSSTPVNSTTGGQTTSVFANDTLGGINIMSANQNLQTVSIVSTSPSMPNLPTVNSSGIISIAPGTPVGTYTITYKVTHIICTYNEVTATAIVTVNCPSCRLSTNDFAAAQSNKNIAIYPNPSSGVFNIDLLNAVDGYNEIKVYNVLGEVVYRSGLTLKSLNQIDLSHVAAGYYMAKVCGGGEDVTFKLIKK